MLVIITAIPFAVLFFPGRQCDGRGGGGLCRYAYAGSLVVAVVSSHHDDDYDYDCGRCCAAPAKFQISAR